MGSLSLKKQNLSTLKGTGFYPLEETIYIFKSPANNILVNILNYLQFQDYSEVLNIYYEGSTSGQVKTFLSDGSSWIDSDSFDNVNNYVIPANSIIIINLNSDKNITVGGGAIIQKYYQGKTSIKKQNLTSLFDYNANPQNNIYTFKSGTVNTISTVFNIEDFTGGGTINTADVLYINNVSYYRKTGIGEGWKTSSNADATNVVINPDSTIFILYINPVDNTPRSVNSGAIIQKYYGGKLNAKRNIAVPSGIEVATTAAVDVAGFTGGDTTYNGTYTKRTSLGGDPSITTPPTNGEVYIKGINTFVLLPPSVAIGGNNPYDGDDYPYSFGPQDNWTISRINDDGEGATSLIVIASNPSSNKDYIPDTDWSPSITITITAA